MSRDSSRFSVPGVRPPKWEVTRPRSPVSRLPITEFQRLQIEHLSIFREKADVGNWSEIHRLHFDWWQFPIDDGSRPEFNLKSEADAQALKDTVGWEKGYLESVRILARSWGWNVDKCCREGRGFWDRKDVRLAKIIRSLWLFEEAEYFASMQQFANYINEKEYNSRGFFYGSICLNEILLMRLPRRETYI